MHLLALSVVTDAAKFKGEEKKHLKYTQEKKDLSNVKII